MKYACLNNISDAGLKNFTRNYYLTDKPEEAGMILVRSQNMHQFEINENLIAVARAGAGVNNIPLDKMGQAGVVVFNAPGANSNAVKEIVIAGLLIASRDIVGGIKWVRANSEDENISKSVEKAKKQFAGNEILGKTIAVIGLGAVGAKVANACLDLGMKVIGYDPYLSENSKAILRPEVEIMEDLDKIYKVSDYITLHLPLLDSTRYMFNKEVFKKVKEGVVLLNFSRDLLVNEKDMEEFLEKGVVRKYVTDFPNKYTAQMNNVIQIPHLGASTKESEDNCAIMAVNSLMVYNETGSILNSVNYPSVELKPQETKYRLLMNTVKNPDLGDKIDEVLADYDEKIIFKVNRTKNEFGYYVYDMEEQIDQKHKEALKAILGMYKVRIITKR